MQKPLNQAIIIFGATGDLTHRKLMPALYALYDQNLLPKNFYVLGVGRKQLDEGAFRKKMVDGITRYSEKIHTNKERIAEFAGMISYMAMDMSSTEGYTALRQRLDATDIQYGTQSNYIFYLSMPPQMFATVADKLGESGLSRSDKGFRRLIIEKPFGRDLESGMRLNRQLYASFDESQIYRIDHYLGKETVQNLLVMRFANGIFEPLWNRNYVNHIEITSAENIGIEGRGAYYDTAGALVDMVQNHLLQIAGLIAMEPPSSIEPDALRNEIHKVFQSLKPIHEEEVVRQVIRGQYTASHIKGELVKGYREEPDIDPDSRTETYVAMKFYIDNWRWGGVPFYIRTGKRLPTKVSEVVVHFKPTPHGLFRQDEFCSTCNQLIIRIQPDEGILLRFGMKQPGTGFNVKNVTMDFHYSELSDIHLPTAYERLIYDSMMGDSSLYARADAVEAAWKFVAPIQKAWAKNPDLKIFGYPAGTWGPDCADNLIEGKHLTWRYPCKNLADDGDYCEL